MFATPVMYAPSLFYAYMARLSHSTWNIPEDAFDKLDKAGEAIKSAWKSSLDAIEQDMQDFSSQEGIKLKFLAVSRLIRDQQCLVVLGEKPKLPAVEDTKIIVAHDVYTADKEACYAAIKYEVAKIKNNESYYPSVLASIISLAYAIFSTVEVMYIASTVPLMAKVLAIVVNTGWIMIVGFAALTIFSRYKQFKNVDSAIANDSDDELKGFRRLLKAEQENMVNIRAQSAWNKMTLSSSGDDRFDFGLRLSYAARLKRIEQELQNRGVVISDEEEKEKIAALVKIISDTKPKVDTTTDAVAES